MPKGASGGGGKEKSKGREKALQKRVRNLNNITKGMVGNWDGEVMKRGRYSRG